MSPNFIVALVYGGARLLAAMLAVFVHVLHVFFRLYRGFKSRLLPIVDAIRGKSGTRKVWSEPEILDFEHDESDSCSWQVCFDALGNGMLVTIDADRVWATRYVVTSGWQNPERIDAEVGLRDGENSGKRINNVLLFFLADNSRLVIWQQTDTVDSSKKIWIKRYMPDTGWDVARPIDTIPYDDESLAITVDSAGRIHAVWIHAEANHDNYDILSQRYDPHAGWEKALVIASNLGDGKILGLKADVSGNIYVIWEQDKSKRRRRQSFAEKGDYHVWVIRYSEGGGWGKAKRIIRQTESRQEVKMAFDARGNAILVWERQLHDRNEIWSIRYLNNKGWDAPRRIAPSLRQSDARQPEVKFDTAGNAMVLWWTGGSDGNIFASHYTAATEWETVVTISQQTRSASQPYFGFDTNGNALAVWTQHNLWSHEMLMSSRYDIKQGWEAPVRISDESKAGKSDPQIVVDLDGNAIALWNQQGILGAGLRVASYRPNNGWNKATRINFDISYSASKLQLFVDAAGTAHAFWSQQPGEHYSKRIWTSRLVTTKILAKQTLRKMKTVMHLFSDGIARSQYGEPSLHTAAFYGDEQEFKRWIAGGKHVDVRSYDQSTPLHAAAGQGHLDLVTLLIDNGADINARKRNGATPLHEAVYANHQEVSELLIKRGAHINARDESMETAIYYAAKNGNDAIVLLLMANGADMNRVATKETSPVYYAVANQRLTTAKLLLQHGAQINSGAEHNYNPLHIAASEGYAEFVELLLAHGAMVNCQNNMGWTPLYLSMYKKDIAIVRMLLSHGANVNVRGHGGETPLHKAWNKEVAELLLGHGADVSATDDDGNTPLHKSIDSGLIEVAELLIERGAEINAENRQSETPLDMAIASRYQHLTETLERRGAVKGSECVIGNEDTILRSAFTKAMDDNEALQEFFTRSEKVARLSPNIKQYAFQLADHTVKLLMNRISKQDYSVAADIVKHYTNRLLPHADADDKTDDVASQALVLAILNRNQEIADLVFEKLLGEDFEMDITDNEVLLFNLACYFATQSQKENMLHAMRHAIRNGKKQEAFLSDADFTAYREAPDFLALLQQDIKNVKK